MKPIVPQIIPIHLKVVFTLMPLKSRKKIIETLSLLKNFVIDTRVHVPLIFFILFQKINQYQVTYKNS